MLKTFFYKGNLFPALSVILLLLTACVPAATEVPAAVTVENIAEESITTGQITTTKTIDQCNATSEIQQAVQFSDSSSQTSQQELTLSATVGGDVGLDAVAQLTLQSAIKQRYVNTTSNTNGSSETVTLTIPAKTKQKYTIIWQETRREGTIQYKENGAAKTSHYSIRTGLNLISSIGQDLICQDGTATSTTVHALTQPPTIPIILSLPADARWVDTNVLLQKGQSIIIASSGKVTLGKRFVDIDANNVSDNLCDKAAAEQAANQTYTIDCLLTGAPGGAVIGRIGDNPPFIIVLSNQFIPSTSGELFLGVNDCCVINDNTGSYLITISVQ